MHNIFFTKLLYISFFLLILLIFSSCTNDRTNIIMAAASLEEILSIEYEQAENKSNFFISYGGSISIARRVENNQNKIGAVILASDSSINILVNKGIIDNKNIRTLAKNSLVLASKNKVESYEEFLNKINLNSNYKIVIADEKIAPAGKYSKQVIDKILSEEIKDKKLISSGDVSYVSNLLMYNEDYYGIIYKSEAIKNDLQVIYEFPNHLHDEIVYRVGILNNNNNLSISNFIDKLTSSELLIKLDDLGFSVEK
ncbi:MAG: molybdate ABC transporter substrate-binding protein [Dehalococcoidia bacterium]|nr:molybdate ABC transporter substrate-binding protein [Dehalococcoidia bacterium]